MSVSIRENMGCYVFLDLHHLHPYFWLAIPFWRFFIQNSFWLYFLGAASIVF